MAQVSPYLNFKGTCEEAFNFYKSVFGGEFMNGIMRFSSMPEHCKPGDENLVMHVSASPFQGQRPSWAATSRILSVSSREKTTSPCYFAESEAEAKKSCLNH